MCGIAGSIGAHSTITQGQLESMTNSLSHRGPDDVGYYINEARSVGLGHRRLSIIDTSADGREPLFNEDKTIVLVFNGELYDYAKLRSTLQQAGHVFTSKTDAEVLIHLYEQEGIECLSKLNGMFAFALYDSKTETTYLVRDRFGIKPLYYTEQSGTVLFGSELRALFAHTAVKRTPNFGAIAQYLALNHVPSPQTGFEGMYSLPPAHIAFVQNGAVRLQKYYTIPTTVSSLNFADAKEVVWQTFTNAVRSMKVADVPLGALLSGGIDSTAVVAALSQEVPNLKTFSVAVPGSSKDETSKAQLAAKYFGTDHMVIPITVSYATAIDTIVDMYEEPYGDSSAIAMNLLAHEVSKHIKVALSGDGGDEIFAGYKRHLYWKIGHYFWPTIYQAIEQNFHFKSPLLRTKFLQEQVALDAITRPKFTKLDQVLRFGINTFLPDDLLKKVDRASMKHGLEVRVPFLDEALVELAFSLPDNYKLHRGTTKYVLREALQGKIPEALRTQGKQGFEVPLNDWCREPGFAAYIDRIRGKSFTASLLGEVYIEQLITQHASGKKQHGTRLWLLIMLETWYSKYF